MHAVCCQGTNLLHAVTVAHDSTDDKFSTKRHSSQKEHSPTRRMESTRELAHHAKQVPRRELRAFTAVANDDLLLVQERRLTYVEDHNEYLVDIVDDLNEENHMLRRALSKAERDNARLQGANIDLNYRHDTLLNQHTALRNVSNQIKATNDDCKASVADAFTFSLEPVTDSRPCMERLELSARELGRKFGHF